MYTVINLKIPEFGSKLIQRRSYKSFNPGNPGNLNNSAVLNDIFNFNFMETAWQMFICEFIKICNIHATIRHHRAKNRNSPWMNNHILSLMYKTKRMLYINMPQNIPVKKLGITIKKPGIRSI